MKKIFKKEIILVLFLAFAVLGVSGCVKNNESEKNQGESQVQENEQKDQNNQEQEKNKENLTEFEKTFGVCEKDWDDAEVIYSSDEHDYTDWKIFVNEELGYSIMYPADWSYVYNKENSLDYSFRMNPPDAESFVQYIYIYIREENQYPGDKSISQILKGLREASVNPKYHPDNPYKEKYVVFSGQKAFRYQTEKYYFESITIPYDKKIYNISTQKRTNPEVKQIIASFKFIDN